MRPDYRGFIVASATNPKQIAEDDSVPQFKMATVTSVSPLRVRYDNELTASPATPRNLVGTLVVGDRVRVTLHRRKIAIDGRIGGTVQPGVVALGSGANLDTLLDWKVYTQDTNSGAASGTNYPVPLAGVLEVLPVAGGGGEHIWQRYTTYRHTTLTGGEEIGPSVYVRAFSSGAWSPWTVIGGEPRIAGVKSAKTYYEKYPDGRLICRGSHSFPANANTRQTYAWTYPVAFVGELPHVTHTAGSTTPRNISTGYSAETLTSVTMEFYRTTGAATGVMFQAEGRWK